MEMVVRSNAQWRQVGNVQTLLEECLNVPSFLPVQMLYFSQPTMKVVMMVTQ